MVSRLSGRRLSCLCQRAERPIGPSECLPPEAAEPAMGARRQVERRARIVGGGGGSGQQRSKTCLGQEHNVRDTRGRRLGSCPRYTRARVFLQRARTDHQPRVALA